MESPFPELPLCEISFDRCGIRRGRAALAQYTNDVIEALDRMHGSKRRSVSVLYCGLERMQTLNRQFREIDSPTDVLSFPFEADDIVADHLGDLAICPPYVASQADRTRRRRENEFALMLVHGYLHLLGFDHDTAEKKKTMWAEQKRLLESLKQIDQPKLVLTGDIDGNP